MIWVCLDVNLLLSPEKVVKDGVEEGSVRVRKCACVNVGLQKWQHQRLNPANCLDRVVELCPTCRRPDSTIATGGEVGGISGGG